MGVRVALAAVVLAIGVAGCSGDDPAPTTVPTAPSSAGTSEPAPTTPAATTPPPSPGPTPPPQPALSRQDSPAGAESFARHYIEVLDYASHTGDTSNLQRLGDCGTCIAQAQGIKEFFAAGGSVVGGQIVIKDSDVVRFVSSAALVNVVYDQAAGKTIPGSGPTEATPALKSETFTLTLARTADSWTVEKLQVLE